MQVLIINLPAATDRREFQEAQLNALGLPHEFINATSTLDLAPEVYAMHYFDWQRPMREVEVACYYSHRKAWQRVIDNEQPALILEDDALLSKRIGEILQQLESVFADLVQLEVRDRKKLVAKESKPLSDRDRLHRLYLDKTGAAGYVLWPSGAHKLLRREQQHGIGLADAHITACHDLDAWQVEPAAVIQLDQCENYGVPAPMDTRSHIATRAKPTIQKPLFFKLKRLCFQWGLLVRQIRYSITARRRQIMLDKEDFV